MAALWSDDARLRHWLEIEILAVEAWARLGVVPEADARQVRERAAFDPARVEELERVTKHDVAAFVQDVAESVGPAGRWVHFGLTSSDVLDTGLALQLREAADLLLEDVEHLLAVTKRLALEHRDTVMAGRTHGVVAEPTSFGHKVALWAFQLDRDRERLRRARETVSVGAISGAVGTYAQVDPRIEEEVCARLGLRPVEASNQIVARDRHAEYLSALGIAAATLDAIATEIRHLTGLARVVRANAHVALENAVLWHERDISHSSAERVILPDSTMALDFMLAEAVEILEGLVVFPQRMRENLDVGGGLAYSQNVLLALVDSGMSRNEAYAIVQRAAASAWDDGASFREMIASDPEVRERIRDSLDELFDPLRALRHLDVVFDRLEKVEVKA